MTLTLDLPSDLREALLTDARNQGKTPEQAILDTLRREYPYDERSARHRHSRPMRPYDPAALRTALASFDEGDEAEQQQTLQILMTNIDRDRLGQRSIFGEGTNPMPSPEEIA